LTAKRPTSADVAERAGVSRTTVSFVLNERADMTIPTATRQRVIDAAAALGYHPHGAARQLARGTSHTLGLVMLQTAEQVAGDAVLADTLRGLAAAARSEDFRVLVETIDPRGGSYAGLLRAAHCDGLVISGPRSDDTELIELVRDDFPIVLQGWLPGLEAPSVDVDNAAGARLAVDHLIALGHRRIGCITNAPLAYTAAAARLDGYRAALEAAGLPFDPTLVAEGAFEPASGHRAVGELLDRGPAGGPLPFTALFVASDVVALGAIGGLRERSIAVPHDVSVVGFDDIALSAYVDPPLTTVHLPAHDLGLAAGRALLDRIARRPVADRTVLPIELIVRGSTAPPVERHRGPSP
jgi:DNA-binding LacI/PurR family transcriptional regulator